MTTGSIAGVARAAHEAVRAIGWKLQIRDGQGSASGRRRALATALRQRPAGIILGGFDATEHPAALREARRRGVPVVGWHAGGRSGPDRRRGLFTNVTTEPAEVARLAASYVIADSNGRAGVLIIRDEQSAPSRFKAQVMRSQLEQCQRCSVLNVLNIPIDSAVVGMPAAVSSTAVRYGERFRYLLVDNGEYVTGARVGLIGIGRRGDEPPFLIAAGDGNASDFDRIRARDYQAASVAEPLYLQGWQLIDELNRARARQPPSGYRAPPRLITRDDVPDGPVFDPASGYRQNYLLIWGR